MTTAQSIYPAILTTNEVVAQSQLTMAATFPGCQIVQIDVIDGWFADNLTISPLDFPALTFDSLGIDLHLMVEEPLDFVYELVSIKDLVPIRTVIVQPERVSGLNSVLEEIRQQDWRIGISLDLGTDVEDIFEEVEAFHEEIAIWQVMGVKAGFQGQRFHPEALETVRHLKKKLSDHFAGELLVDGGIKPENLPILFESGATGSVVGSFLWRHLNPLDQWQQLQTLLAK